MLIFNYQIEIIEFDVIDISNLNINCIFRK